MAKKHCNFRVEDSALEVITDYAAEWNLDNNSKALQRILLRFKYLDKARAEQLQTNEDDALACVSRIKYDGVFWCVYKPPRMRELETLDICVVCKKRSLNLNPDSAKTLIEAEKSIARSGAQTEPSPHLNMVSTSSKTPFSYASDRSRSRDDFNKPAPTRPPSFHCPKGQNSSFCYSSACDQRRDCKTQVQR